MGQTIANHPNLVEQALAGGTATIRHRFGSVTGEEALLDDYNSDIVFRSTYAVTVIITYDPDERSRDYRVITAFPMNDLPNEVIR